MNYIKIYYDIVNNAIHRGLDKKKLEGYFERHHIIPACYFKSRKIASYKENLVLLTGEEHIICHHLLWKNNITNNKLFLAYHKMVYQRNKFQDRRIELTAKQYEILRETISYIYKNRIVSDDTKRKMKNAWELRKLSDSYEEHKEKLRLSHSSNETKQKMRIAKLGKPLTDIHKKHIGESYNVSKEAIDAMRLKMLGNDYAKGNKLSDDTRGRISKSLKGRIPWNKGLTKQGEHYL